jgi:hypothetical protein
MAPEEGLQDVVSYPKIACEVQTHFLCQCSEETALSIPFLSSSSPYIVNIIFVFVPTYYYLVAMETSQFTFLRFPRFFLNAVSSVITILYLRIASSPIHGYPRTARPTLIPEAEVLISYVLASM